MFIYFAASEITSVKLIERSIFKLLVLGRDLIKSVSNNFSRLVINEFNNLSSVE